MTYQDPENHPRWQARRIVLVKRINTQNCMKFVRAWARFFVSVLQPNSLWCILMSKSHKPKLKFGMHNIMAESNQVFRSGGTAGWFVWRLPITAQSSDTALANLANT